MTHTASRRSVLAMLASPPTVAAIAWVIPSPAFAQGARAILRAAFDNWRADSSHAVLEMTIRRASGTRNMTLESWTSGEKKALVRFTAPARDAGNATLQLGNSTYVFNPKLNQVIKLPASAMSQSWMGSDFSYEDLARSEKVIDDYTHRRVGTKRAGGHTIHVIQSVPKPRVPVIWGKEIVSVRDDGVLYSIAYYDQVGRRVRIMTADRISTVSGRPYPTVLTMRTDAKPGQYTRIKTMSAEFNMAVPGYLFTKSNLQNPRD